MAESMQTGDRVQIYLDAKNWRSEGWFSATVIKIDPYSQHRSFYWVELDQDVQSAFGGSTRMISVLNPKNIRKLPSPTD